MSKKKRKMTESSEASTSTVLTVEKAGPPDVFYGMSKVNENAYEVWAHEDCVVWSSGVHIIGARIVGLEEAVWSSSRHQCVICLKFGAIISCLQRGCREEAHYPCALKSQWSLDEQCFQSRCNKHKGESSNANGSDTVTCAKN